MMQVHQFYGFKLVYQTAYSTLDRSVQMVRGRMQGHAQVRSSREHESLRAEIPQPHFVPNTTTPPMYAPLNPQHLQPYPQPQYSHLGNPYPQAYPELPSQTQQVPIYNQPPVQQGYAHPPAATYGAPVGQYGGPMVQHGMPSPQQPTNYAAQPNGPIYNQPPTPATYTHQPAGAPVMYPTLTGPSTTSQAPVNQPPLSQNPPAFQKREVVTEAESVRPLTFAELRAMQQT